MEQLVRIVGDLPVGSIAKVKVLRNGIASRPTELKVTIEKRDEAYASSYAKLWPGLSAVSLSNPDLRKGLVPDGTKGCIIINVMPKSPAATMELRPGDIVIAINEKKVSNLLDFYRLLSEDAKGRIAFTVLRDGHELTTLAYVRK
jgi:S1-C subfamily serine protease